MYKVISNMSAQLYLLSCMSVRIFPRVLWLKACAQHTEGKAGRGAEGRYPHRRQLCGPMPALRCGWQTQLAEFDLLTSYWSGISQSHLVHTLTLGFCTQRTIFITKLINHHSSLGGFFFGQGTELKI